MKLLTCGCFDLFHYGHANFLERASEWGDVVVALGTDEAVEYFKGKGRPIYSFEHREAILKSCRYVSDVIEHGYQEDMSKEYQRLLDVVKPDGFVQGTQRGSGHMGIHEVLKRNNIKRIITVESDPVHTSEIIEDIVKKDHLAYLAQRFKNDS